MEKRRVVITGLGAITPLGIGAEESWGEARRGTCGIGPITSYDASGRKVTLAAEVKGFDAAAALGTRKARRTARFAQFALVAAREAWAASGLADGGFDAERAACVISSGIGGVVETEEQQTRALEHGFDRVSPYYIPMTISNLAAGEVAIDLGLKGLCTCPVTACAGGSNAVGDAFRHIRDGYAEVAVAGGTEAAITPLSMGGFTTIRALHTGDDPTAASIPFDARRSGFVMGEGAACVVLEELGHALRRAAPIVAEVVGYGATCDAHHVTAPAADGEGGARAMACALADAGVEACEVDYINAHGTSTPLNDACETAAIKTVFKDHARRLAVSSTKSMTGHMLGAAGAVEAVFCACALRDGFLPPTMGLREADPACDLDYVPDEGRRAAVRYALSNSLGFGGHNACLLFKSWEG